MTTLQLEISPEQLLAAIGRLDTPSLDKVAHEVSLMRARRHAPSLSKGESQLLSQISATTLSAAKREQLHQLGEKAEAQTLTESERTEFVALSERSEQLNAERLALVAELAALRDQPFVEVIAELGLFNPYVPSAD